MASIIKEPDLVVALDIGSTYSGYAWQTRNDFRNNRSNVQFNTNWDSGAQQLHKTTSCVLLEGDYDSQNIYERERTNKNKSFDDFKRIANNYKLVGFGHYAERKYGNILRKNEIEKIIGKWLFFKRFKHLLYCDEFHRSMDAEDHFGQHVPLLVVMSMLIKGLKDHFITNIQEPPEKTLWVVTVPAIWSEHAGKFMREAAEMCDIKSTNLLLANEPESAAVYCMFLPQGKGNNTETLEFTGQTFLVADLGGLTADLSALEVLQNGDLREVVTTSGDVIGGQNINDCFFQVCQESFRGDGWRKIFTSMKPVEMLKMENDFESKKIVIGTGNPEDEYIPLDVPAAVTEKLKSREITLRERAEKEHCFSFKDMEFCFESDYVKKILFGETCARIYKTIQCQLKKKELQVCNILVLVGGFSQSPIVRTYITERASKDFPAVKVISPTSPFQAVLKGAVIFGHDPLIFRSRISRWTFGIEVNVPFDEKVHNPEKKFKNTQTNEFYCKDIFSKHVQIGESITLNAKRKTFTYSTLYEYQTSMMIAVYKSEYTDPKYVTDRGCVNIGNIKVLLPKRRPIRNINVSMTYGGTELAVIAKDCETGEECKADIEFRTMENKLESKTLQVSGSDEETCTTM
ncbi:heat shock 70 kDa protein 12B-like isoform X1 [Mercenaria mercenaria]|uniref:heat shock 70 kDa protein 12B-like isoform X1 n=1 Tax=Mercenaria mercenaria TaxID=6596 RepID=UPI00234EC04C|nr:heat shock 70 kDa protein 12B-like isoform X1 [Mercenaria mercenaria]